MESAANSGAAWKLRAPCRWCGAETGVIEKRGGQNTVTCDGCGRMLYNAPKSETGEEQRSVRSRPDIKPSQRARILERYNGACAVCHATNRELHVGHIVSVEEGRALGLIDAELYDDLNLTAQCEECNLGQGARSLTTSLAIRLIAANLQANYQRAARKQHERDERMGLFDDEDER